MNTKAFENCCNWYREFHELSSKYTDDMIYQTILKEDNPNLQINEDLSGQELFDIVSKKPGIVNLAAETQSLAMYCKFIEMHLPMKYCYILKIANKYYGYWEKMDNYYTKNMFVVIDIPIEETVFNIPDDLTYINNLSKYKKVHSIKFKEELEDNANLFIVNIVTILIIMFASWGILVTNDQKQLFFGSFLAFGIGTNLILGYKKVQNARLFRRKYQ